MSRCVDYEPLIELLLGDEIGDADRDRLLRHAETCAACREFVDLHYRMLHAELDTELPGEAAFAAMRRSVLDALPPVRARRVDASRQPSWMRWLLLRPALAGAALAGVVVGLLAGGIAIGRQTARTVIEPASVAMALDIEAGRHRALSDIEDSPYLFSNVGFDRRADGHLELVFDVTRHMRLVRSEDDPLVREMLVQSLLNPSPVATRLTAIEYAGRALDPRVKEALIITLFNDPNQAVRLRALEILAEQGDDVDVQIALLAVLRDDESVQLRMKALDYLAQGGLGSERLADVLGELSPVEDRALLVRAAGYTPRPSGGARP